MGHVIDLSKAAIDAGEYLKLIEKYKDDPKMIIGVYESYAKVDPVPVNKRVRILLKFLEKLSEEKLNYVGGLPPQMLRRQEAATDMFKSINKLFIQRTLQIAKDSKALSNFDASGLLNQEGFKVKKIKINLKEIATNVDTLKESRFKFLDDLLGTPAPRVSLGDLGAQSIQVAGKRVLRSASIHKSVKDPDAIKVVDDYIDAATAGAENLESITKKAAAEAALDGAPIIVKIEKKLDLFDPSTGKPYVYTKYILVAEDGLVAVGRESDFSALERLSRKVKEAQEARKTTGAAPADAPRPAAVGKAGPKLAKIEEDVAEMLRISLKGDDFFMGSIKNPFPNQVAYEYYIKGGVFKFSDKLPFLKGKTMPRLWAKQYREYLADRARRESNTFSELNMWHAIQPTGREGDFVYIGSRSADGTTKVSAALGYQNGTLTPSSAIKQVKTAKKTAAGEEQTLGQESIAAGRF